MNAEHVTSPSSLANFRKRKQTSLHYLDEQRPLKQMKHAGQTNYTPVMLSQPYYRYDDLHYDSWPLGNLYMPYDPNQTVTLQTPDLERNNIISLTPGYYPVSFTPLLDSNFMNFYDPRRPGSCMVPYSLAQKQKATMWFQPYQYMCPHQNYLKRWG